MQRVERSVFGELNGKPIHLFRLANANGMVAELLEFGGRIKALCIPDGQGGLDNMSVGYDTFEPYHARFNPWLGALLGRTASRVTGAQFQIDGKTYNLSASGPAGSNMHGGFVGARRTPGKGRSHLCPCAFGRPRQPGGDRSA